MKLQIRLPPNQNRICRIREQRSTVEVTVRDGFNGPVLIKNEVPVLIEPSLPFEGSWNSYVYNKYYTADLSLSINPQTGLSLTNDASLGNARFLVFSVPKSFVQTPRPI